MMARDFFAYAMAVPNGVLVKRDDKHFRACWFYLSLAVVRLLSCWIFRSEQSFAVWTKMGGVLLDVLLEFTLQGRYQSQFAPTSDGKFSRYRNTQLAEAAFLTTSVRSTTQ